MRPRYAQLADQYGVGDWVRFMQPPPNALLLWPLSWFNFHSAHRVWLALGAIAGWAICLQAGRIFELLHRQPSRASGWIILLTGTSLLMYRSVRVGNVSTIVGALLGWCVIALIKQRDTTAGITTMLSGVIKYVGGVFVPLLIAMRRWRALIVLVISGIALLALSLAVMGAAPFRIYLNEIWPTLSRSLPDPANQSLEAFLLRILRAEVLSHPLNIALSALRVGSILIILLAITRNWRLQWSGSRVCAAATALIAWMLIFSPMFWEHYHAYLVPLWGWLIYEAMRSRGRAIVALLAIAMAWSPTPVILKSIHIPEPLNSHMLMSAIVMMCFAIVELFRSRRDLPPRVQL
jgi:hypothetical protein